MKKKISIVEFEAAVEAAKILLFAKLLSISYDQEEKIFLPFRMIPMDKKRINNSDIEKILTDCIAHKNNVKMSFLSQSGPKQVQNILNTALKCVYPFLRYILYKTELLLSMILNLFRFQFDWLILTTLFSDGYLTI